MSKPKKLVYVVVGKFGVVLFVTTNKTHAMEHSLLHTVTAHELED